MVKQIRRNFMTWRHRLMQRRHDERIQEEARIANDIQAQQPDVSRSEALRLACKFLDRE